MVRVISCLMVGGVLASGCSWMPETRLADGIKATEFSYLLTGANQGIALRPQPDVLRNRVRQPKKAFTSPTSAPAGH